MTTGKSYLGYTASAQGAQQFSTINPVLNAPNPEVFTAATSGEIDAAAALAQQAFGAYQRVPATQRAAFLRAIADEIEALGEPLIDLYCRESGLPKGRAEGERGRTTGQLRAFASLLAEGSWVAATIDRAQPHRLPLPRVDLRKMSIPIGPIAVFGASNFPLAFSVAGGDTASALAAGCPVAVKAHPLHAGTGELVATAILRAARAHDLPDGVFSYLLAADHAAGLQLVQHPAIKGVGFTGSLQGGRALYDAAAQRPEPIPVFAEMGSTNPVVLLPSALAGGAAHWAGQLAASVTVGTGQFCTKPGLILAVQGEPFEQFAEALGQQIAHAPAGHMLHPSIHARFEEGQAAMSAQQGAHTVASPVGELAPNMGRPTLMRVSGQQFLANPALQHEVFGPFALLVACKSADELLAAVRSLAGQLTGTILGEAHELAAQPTLIAALQGRVGRLIFNGVPTGVEVSPAMSHGGPYPASTDGRFTAVGTHAIQRWVRPCTFQNWPDELLPPELQDSNPLGIMRLLDGTYTHSVIERT